MGDKKMYLFMNEKEGKAICGQYPEDVLDRFLRSEAEVADLELYMRQAFDYPNVIIDCAAFMPGWKCVYNDAMSARIAP